MTPQEYLAAERRAEETKHEYHNGEIFAMSGASARHNIITANLIGSLVPSLRGGPCRVYASDMRLKVEPGGLYTYPDVAVVCGKPLLEDEHFDTLLPKKSASVPIRPTPTPTATASMTVTTPARSTRAAVGTTRRRPSRPAWRVRSTATGTRPTCS
jgi:hypothetical protein